MHAHRSLEVSYSVSVTQVGVCRRALVPAVQVCAGKAAERGGAFAVHMWAGGRAAGRSKTGLPSFIFTTRLHNAPRVLGVVQASVEQWFIRTPLHKGRF